jgi:putative membrane protein
MKPILILGKLATAFAWLMMFYNLAAPFDGNIAAILNILLAVTVFMHCFQTIIFHTIFNSLIALKKGDYLQVFIFGVFSLLQYRQLILAQQKS